jgi:catechol 2,3-dioxygenase-like lactoylglutathione lyase family enzyme
MAPRLHYRAAKSKAEQRIRAARVSRAGATGGNEMFANRRATAMIPAKDFARAKRWYEEKLGLTPTEEFGDDMGATYKLGGGTVAFLYPTQYAGTAQHTIMSFDSPNLMEDMKALRAKGLAFLDYDLPGLKTENGVADFGTVKNAWAQDSEGNIIAFVQGM